MEISFSKTRNKIEELKLQGSERGLEWILLQLEQWEVELDEERTERIESMARSNGWLK